jgi:hypothetical protein
VATAVTDLPVDLSRPGRDAVALAIVAEQWGVERQVADLVKALDR